MIEGLLVLLLCQVIGTFLAAVLHLQVPGAVIGMLLLLALLAWRRPEEDSRVLTAGNRILDELPLLFIPAGVGVISCLGLIRAHVGVLVVGMVLPWAAGLAATAGVATLLQHMLTTDEDRLGSEAQSLVDDSERMDGMETGRMPIVRKDS